MIIKGRIIDGTGADPIEKGVIVIKNRRIVDVGLEKDIETPTNDDNVINASDKTIIPGLIDGHIHLCRSYGSTPLNSYHVAESTLYGLLYAKKCINAGITTIRDLGCKHRGIFALKKEVETSNIIGPRMIIAGRIIYQSGRISSLGIQADGEIEVRKIAREELGRGADWVKIYASGTATGDKFRDPWDVWMTDSEISAACEEAHNKGKKAAAHAMNAESAMKCIEGGIDSIEHGILLNNDTFEDMKKNNIFYVPTIYTFYRTGNYDDIKTGLTKSKESMVKDRLKNKLLPIHKKNVKLAKDIGVKIVAGTDVPNPDGNIVNIKADYLANEISLMVEYGFTHMYALKTATKFAAEMVGMDDKIGTLQKGKIADLIILENDPLRNIKALFPENIWLVLKEGKIIKFKN